MSLNFNSFEFQDDEKQTDNFGPERKIKWWMIQTGVRMSDRQRFVQTDRQTVNDPEREDRFKVGIVQPRGHACHLLHVVRSISKMADNLVKETKQGKGKWRSLIGQTQNLRGSDWSNSILDLSFTTRVEVNIQDGSQPGQRGHGKGNQGGVSDWSSTKFAGI